MAHKETGSGWAPRPASECVCLAADTRRITPQPLHPQAKVIRFPERRDGIYIGFGGREFCPISSRLRASIRRLAAERRGR